MKIYFRILRYAPNLSPQLTKFFVYSVFGVIFNAIYLGLTMPLIEVLFSQPTGDAPTAPPEFSFSIVPYFKGMFQYHFARINSEQGKLDALMFVCVSIVIAVFLSNLFRYMERMTASRMKVDIVKNLRLHVFESVSRMHIGFFN